MRIEQLTFTRFIAAISIVIFHYGQNSFLFNNQYLSFIFKQANIGVSYFFILSGFVMTIVYYPKKELSIKQFLVNRVARIYPLYIFAIILILFIKLFRLVDFKELTLNIFMIQSWFPKMALTLNYPGWSLSVELFFYLCFIPIINFIKNKRISTIAFIILLFWFISQVIYHHLFIGSNEFLFYSARDIKYLPIFHLNEFLIGIFTGLLFLKSMKKKLLHSNNTIIIILLLLLVLFLKYPLGFNYHNGLLAAIFAPLIFFISKSSGKMSSFFSNKIFIFLGEISYGIYLLQYPVWKAMGKIEKYFDIINEYSDNTIFFLLKLFILILLSSLTYKYIETPMRKLIRRPQ